jgi:hypothetical protein
MTLQAVVACVVSVIAQASPPPAAAPSPPPEQQDMPWFAKLGMRSLAVETKLPVVDRVVLVPDEGAYLAEISKWTTKARWPVLFEDAAFAPRFIRAFKPAQVIRRAAGSPPADAAALRAACDAAICRAWNGDPAAGQVAAFRAVGLVPAGMVVASAADPSWTAAVALAAGRGQPLLWGEQPLGGSANDVLDAGGFATFDADVRKAFASSGLRWDALGDDLETLTLCRRAALRVNLPAPPGGRNPQLPRDDGPLSLTDSLCRNADGSRYAFASQVFGDRVRAASMAMCSLFLGRAEAWMFNGYAERGNAGAFPAYSFAKAAPALADAGWRTRTWEGQDGTVAGWRSMLAKGVLADLVFVNSSGHADFFELEPSSIVPSTDIPVLRTPVALSMVHSFSLQQPDTEWSIGGRWLAHGAYAYVGSVHEPFLSAFVPPEAFVQRLLSLAPFVVAGRQWPGDPIPQAWRVATIGDPLMTVPAPKVMATMPGRDAPPAVGDGEVDVRAAARAALERSKSASAEAAAGEYALAMRDLVMVGDDALAVQLWKLARAKGAGDAVAGLALGALFRAGTRADFMDAWALAKAPTDEERDMLWQLWAVDLPALRDRAAVAVLKAAVREPRLDMDAKALVKAVRAVDGAVAADTWLNDLIARAKDPDTKRTLAQLQGAG